MYRYREDHKKNLVLSWNKGWFWTFLQWQQVFLDYLPTAMYQVLFWVLETEQWHKHKSNRVFWGEADHKDKFKIYIGYLIGIVLWTKNMTGKATAQIEACSFKLSIQGRSHCKGGTWTRLEVDGEGSKGRTLQAGEHQVQSHIKWEYYWWWVGGGNAPDGGHVELSRLWWELWLLFCKKYSFKQCAVTQILTGSLWQLYGGRRGGRGTNKGYRAINQAGDHGGVDQDGFDGGARSGWILIIFWS